MPGGAPDRIAEGGVSAAPHRSPCSDAKLRPRLVTGTNGARLADNVPSARRPRRLRPASPQRRFRRSPPRAAHLPRERLAATKAQPLGRRWCAAPLLLQRSLFRGHETAEGGFPYIQRATGSVTKARTSVAMACSTWASPAMVATPGGVICIVMFLSGRGVMGLQRGRVGLREDWPLPALVPLP